MQAKIAINRDLCRLAIGNKALAQELGLLALPCVLLILIERYSHSPFEGIWALLRSEAFSFLHFLEDKVKPGLSVGLQTGFFVVFDVPARSVLVLGKIFCCSLSLDFPKLQAVLPIHSFVSSALTHTSCVLLAGFGIRCLSGRSRDFWAPVTFVAWVISVTLNLLSGSIAKAEKLPLWISAVPLLVPMLGCLVMLPTRRQSYLLCTAEAIRAEVARTGNEWLDARDRQAFRCWQITQDSFCFLSTIVRYCYLDKISYWVTAPIWFPALHLFKFCWWLSIELWQIICKGVHWVQRSISQRLIAQPLPAEPVNNRLLHGDIAAAAVQPAIAVPAIAAGHNDAAAADLLPTYAAVNPMLIKSICDGLEVPASFSCLQ